MDRCLFLQKSTDLAARFLAACLPCSTGSAPCNLQRLPACCMR
jgi:hypothetical protein